LGAGKYLHSRYDPLREATRLAGRQEGYLVILGLGCGFLAAAAAGEPGVAGVLAIEPVPAVARTVSAEAELSHLRHASDRLRILYTDSPQLLREAVQGFYTPALHEKVSLHITEGYDSLLELEPFRDAFREGVQRAVANYGTMARLGRTWTRNIIANASALASQRSGERGLLAPPREPPRKAVVLGAGPGLESWLSSEAPSAATGAQETPLILAADTALPVLLSRGIIPHIVASIDSQAATYHHYLAGSRTLSMRAPLVLTDLTAPPLLSRLPHRQLFFGGGHPLAELLLTHTSLLTGLSTEGGNVGYTLLSAAAALGAEEVDIAGIDYAYLAGSAYARGSYLDQLFFSRTHRLHPLLSRWSDILWRDPQFRRIGPWSYTDPRLRRFAESFREAVAGYADRGLRIHWSPGATPAGRLPEQRESPSDPERGISPSAGRFSGAPEGFDPRRLPRMLPAHGLGVKLAELAERLSGAGAGEPRPPWLLSPEEKALLPLAAWYREHPRRGEAAPLEAARRLTLEYLDRRAP
jgi:hypothetical protein